METSEEEELQSVLAEQRRQLMEAKALASDLDLAYNLQMQEAITASLSHHPSSSHSPPPLQSDAVYSPSDEGFDLSNLMLQEIDRFEQERKDREQSEAEMRKMRDDLDRRIHDRRFSSEIMRIPEDEWKHCGDNYEKPYDNCSCSSSLTLVGNERFRLHFKGLVSEETIKDKKVIVAGVGIAICDASDSLIFEVSKGLVGGELMSNEEAELAALVEGLNAALSLGLNELTILCGDFKVYQYITQGLQPRHSKLATLVNQVAILQRKYTHCNPYFVVSNDIKFAFKLAKDAIVSQITWPVETRGGKSLMETCVICYENTDVGQMFSVEGCLHRYCFSCMKRHVEVKFHNGMVVKCPHEGCKSEVNIDSCGKFLDPKLVEIISQRTKEDLVPVSEKVYCPYPRCSALMSKSEVLKYTDTVFIGAKQSGARKCMKCGFFFCINCKVPWHYNMTCHGYKKSNPHPPAEDALLKSLARKEKWRECKMCHRIVELAEGCYHITCRCGYEFCYTCGAEWKHNKATCACLIWDEHNILHDRGQRQ